MLYTSAEHTCQQKSQWLTLQAMELICHISMWHKHIIEVMVSWWNALNLKSTMHYFPWKNNRCLKAEWLLWHHPQIVCHTTSHSGFILLLLLYYSIITKKPFWPIPQDSCSELYFINHANHSCNGALPPPFRYVSCIRRWVQACVQSRQKVAETSLKRPSMLWTSFHGIHNQGCLVLNAKISFANPKVTYRWLQKSLEEVLISLHWCHASREPATSQT